MRRFSPILATAFLAVLLAIPACNKKTDNTEGNGGGDPSTEGVQRNEVKRNLKKIGYAMHNYFDRNGHLPRGIYGPDGKTLGLSWRVAILPFIEQEAVYKQFKLNEAWDSPHNKQLIAQMPSIYASPGQNASDGKTRFCSFEGRDALMRPVTTPGTPGTPARGLHLEREITDGTSNTLMVVEAAEPVIWTKPDDIPFDPTKPLPKFGPLVVVADGSAPTLVSNPPESELKKFITPAGNEIPSHDIFIATPSGTN